MNTTDTDLAATLDAAADYLDTYGWCQGELYDQCAIFDDGNPTPSACALGALYITVSGAPIEALCVRDPVAYRRAEAAASLVVDTLGLARAGLAVDEFIQPVDELVSWNDHPRRTEQEVIGIFRRIAADHHSERAS